MGNLDLPKNEGSWETGFLGGTENGIFRKTGLYFEKSNNFFHNITKIIQVLSFNLLASYISIFTFSWIFFNVFGFSQHNKSIRRSKYEI